MKKIITKREKLVYTTFIALLIAILLLFCVTDIYAKYASAFIGESSIDIKNWIVSVNDVLASSKENNVFTFDIEEENGKTKIEPGDKGTFNLKIKNDSNVNAKYTIKFKVYYKGTEDLAMEFSINSYDKDGNNVEINTYEIQGDINSGITEELTFNWNWESTTGDYEIVTQRTGFTVKAEVKIEEVIE